MWESKQCGLWGSETNVSIFTTGTYVTDTIEIWFMNVRGASCIAGHSLLTRKQVLRGVHISA